MRSTPEKNKPRISGSLKGDTWPKSKDPLVPAPGPRTAAGRRAVRSEESDEKSLKRG